MKFMLTRELGRLTRWLRLLGHDAASFDSDDMKGLFLTAFNESRVIVTKRRRIRGAKSVKIIYVKSDFVKEQLSELKKKLRKDIRESRLFTRCADCNKEVFKIKKASVRSLVPEYVFKTQRNFYQCPACGRVFWKATHWDRAKDFLDEVHG